MVHGARPDGGGSVSRLEKAILQRIDTVYDPCSVRMGQPLGLVAMGLVEAPVIENDAIRIRLVLTGPGCFFYFQFADEIERVLAPIADGRTIEVSIDDTVMWTPDRVRRNGGISVDKGQ